MGQSVSWVRFAILRRVFFLLLIVGVVVSTQPRSVKAGTIGDTKSNADDAAKKLAANYGNLPLSFEVNEGQSAAPVQYIARGSGYTLFLAPGEATMKLRQEKRGQNSSDRTANLSAIGAPAVLRMQLQNANPAAQPEGLDPQAGTSNYFIGNNSERWHANAIRFSRVNYKDTYPGIDLVYYGNQRQLEYDFVVASGADPGVIEMKVAADAESSATQSTPLSIAANGDLLVPVGAGKVQFHAPVAYQQTKSASDTKSTRSLVSARWVLKGNNRVGFELGAYDSRNALVIDPALSFSTYLGGSEDDNAYSVATDASANVYVVGTTESTDFPTQNPYQAANAGNNDVFVTKLNPTGTSLIYSTYLGGSAADFPFGLVLNSAGDAYIVGTTSSTNFPVTSGAFQKTCASCNNGTPSVFVTELNTTGSALVYSTFIGGTGDSRGYALALDSTNNVYVTGRTSSADYPTTTGVFQKTLNGTLNVFVTKLNATGSALAYSTFLGGSGTDQANGIAVDTAGNAYVAGSSTSTNFPTTTGAFQTALHGTSNAIVSKLNNKGTALAYSTYLGGSAADTVWGIRVDGAGNAYLAGQTTSSNFPTTTGAFQTTCGGACALPNGFVTKMNSTGSPMYSTFLGGTGEQEAFALTIDSSGDAYVTGRTSSTDFPLTHGSFQTTFGGVFDVFVTELNPTGSALYYSTFFGGNGSDAGLGITLDASKNIYVTGRTYSSNFPTTPTAFATTCPTCSDTGFEDAFVAKFIAGDQVWPLALNFGSQQVGVKSAALTAVLSNSGSTALGINGFSITGVNASDFAQTNTCGSSLTAGATCKISVTFTPVASGTRSATLAISDSATNTPQQVALLGTGSNNSVSLNPATLTFPTQLVGTASTAQNSVLMNTGAAAVNITNVAATGQFTQTNNCGASLAIGGSCTISVIFQPTAQGTDKGSVKITDDAAGSPQSLTLTGSGTVIGLTPTSVAFGNQAVGTTSVAQTVTVTNHGSAAVTVKKIGFTGTGGPAFAQTNTCGTSIAAGASCAVSVTFTPKSKSTYSASLSIADNGGGSPQSAALSGTGD